jgi:FkbM family methyltransferase
MINTKAILKDLALRILPERMLQVVKKVHYVQTLESLSEGDERDFRIIRHLVSPGDWVVDIGANNGVYTKYLSELVGAEGRVYSIEPIPLTLDILLSNVRKLGLKNVELMNCAISDFNGRGTMKVPLYESGGENFYQAKIVSENADSSLRRIEVQSRSVDSLFSDLDHGISFIKCDAEGHELKCVKGASGTIKNSKPAWLIEVSRDPDDPGSAAHETFRLLNQESYEAFWFDGKSLRKRRTGDKSVNYFFLSAQHLRALREESYKSQRVRIKW